MPRTVANALLAAAAAVAVALAITGSSEPGWLVAYDVAGVVTVAVFGVAVARVHRRARTVWWLLVAAVALSLVGDIFADFTVIAGTDLTGFGFDSVAYLAGSVLLLVAVGLLVRQRAQSANALVWLDAGLITVTAAALVAAFVIVPTAESGYGLWSAEAVIGLYPLLDVVVVAVLLRLVLTSAWTPPLFLLTVSQVLYLAADLAYDVAALRGDGDGQIPGVVQAGWLASYVLLAYAASRRDAAELTDPGIDADARRFHAGEFAVVAALTLAIPAVLLAVGHGLDGADLLVLLVANVSLMVLVLARAWLLLRTAQTQSDALAQLARTDALTGLLNRRSWLFEMQRHARNSDARAGTVAFIDLDRFKEFNDDYGHPAGDDLLRGCAAAWTAVLPADAVLARLGGDEFAVLLPRTGTAQAAALLDRMRHVTPDGVGMSAGVTGWKPGDPPDRVTEKADIALYAAKRSGRDRTETYQPDQA